MINMINSIIATRIRRNSYRRRRRRVAVGCALKDERREATSMAMFTDTTRKEEDAYLKMVLRRIRDVNPTVVLVQKEVRERVMMP
jgi:hypothetical protein